MSHEVAAACRMTRLTLAVCFRLLDGCFSDDMERADGMQHSAIHFRIYIANHSAFGSGWR